MSAIKDGRVPIELGGKTRYLLFDLNVMDEVQDKFGGYDQLQIVMSKENPDHLKNIRWLVTVLINEGVDENDVPLTEKEVGRMIHPGTMSTLIQKIYAAFTVGVSGGETPPTEQSEQTVTESNDAGNATGGQAV